jgi:hypothetical protein
MISSATLIRGSLGCSMVRDNWEVRSAIVVVAQPDIVVDDIHAVSAAAYATLYNDPSISG